MEWQKLELSKASLVKKEVDTVLSRLAEIATNLGDIDRSALVSTVQNRIQELENFYLKHSDDERAILFEKERLRLRKGLQPFYGSSSKDNRSVSASETFERSVHDTGSAIKLQDKLSVSQLSRTNSRLHNSAVKSPRSALWDAAGTSGKGTPGKSTKAGSLSPGQIYAWEERSEKPLPRDSMDLNGVTFDPSPVTGLYSRHMTRGEEAELMSDRFIDVQIVLTQEELATLAARKKAHKPQTKLFKNQAASSSVHTAVPYIDPSRIKRDMLRPGHPDRWLGSESFTH
ncbi:hypothetical protein EON64_00205 [archaeon]|nr:MAG: hypothetical protein EON64_00205 [archaeon]